MFKITLLQCYLAEYVTHSNSVSGYEASEMVVLEDQDCSFEITESCSPTIEGENNY